MKKLTLLALSTAILSGSALAYTDSVMDPKESYESAVTAKIVRYSCQSDKKVVVKYGFNKQELPTYATSFLDGKFRFMPINLGRSGGVDLVFGDKENFSIMSSPFNVNDYKKASINIQSASGEILFKGCSKTK